MYVITYSNLSKTIISEGNYFIKIDINNVKYPRDRHC